MLDVIITIMLVSVGAGGLVDCTCSVIEGVSYALKSRSPAC